MRLVCPSIFAPYHMSHELEWLVSDAFCLTGRIACQERIHNPGDNMREGEAEKQFKALQQEIALAGEELEALRRNQRAMTDALRLEVETLLRCLKRLHPEFEECFAAVRAEVAQEINPEAV